MKTKEVKAQGGSHYFPVLKGQLLREEKLSLHKEPHGEYKRQWIQDTWEKVRDNITSKTFLIVQTSFTGTTSPGTWYSPHHWMLSTCDWIGY